MYFFLMQGFQRSQVETLLRRLDEQPHRIIAVFAPRQTGKTKLVRQALRRTERFPIYRSLDEMDAAESNLSGAERTLSLPQKPNAEWLVQTWRHARREAEKRPRGVVLAIDEIHTLPQWSSTIKGLWDADRANDRNMHVIILGSAPLRIQSGLTESLAGRFEQIGVSHWSFNEMADAFNFDLAEYIYFGGYPGSAHLIREEERWRSYVFDALIKPSIEKDILAMTKVEKPALLRQLFALGADYSGQILSYNKMLGQLQDAGNATTLVRYLDLLSTAGLISGLPKYSTSPRQVRASTPKLNVRNTALATVSSGYTFAEAQADRSFWGRLVESAVGAHILNAAKSNMHAYYWRKSHFEVDFIVRRGPRTIAIEVKSGPQRRRLPGMEAFSREFSPHRTLLIGDGGAPLADFLTSPLDRWFDDP